MAFPRGPASFLRFSGVSGLGWLIDASLLLLLVAAAGAAPLPANVASASLAAAFVFLVSRRRIHGGEGAAGPRLTAYLVYTLLLILAASAVLAALTPLLEAPLGRPGAVAAAKVIVTPPQLVLNFLVSRELARFGSPRHG